MNAKSDIAIDRKIGPNAPRFSAMEVCTYAAPPISVLKETPEDRHINAVAVQINRVSMKTESI